jgi:RNA polymerase sigma factor (sigma-70 family)
MEDPGLSMHPRGPDRPAPEAESQWQERLIELAARLIQRLPDSDRRVVPALWQLLYVKLLQHMRAQSRRLGALAHEDLEELASQKALDLLNRIDSGEWDAAHAAPAEVVGFVSTVARNGVVDALRRGARQPRTSLETWMETEDSPSMTSSTEHPDGGIARREFAQALVACAEHLRAVHRRIWIFRVFYDMSSKQIASHPEVDLKASHVDVILQRSRERLRRCMQSRGLDTSEMPPGCFAALWSAFRLDEALEGAGPDDR